MSNHIKGLREASIVFLLVSLVTGISCVSSHSTPNGGLTQEALGSPFDDITAQVKSLSSKECRTGYLIDVGSQRSTGGCFASTSEGVKYFYRDSAGRTLVAGREWNDSVSENLDSLRMWLNHRYGNATDCLAVAPRIRVWFSSYQQWHAPGFTVQVTNEAEGGRHRIMLQFIRSSVSCDFSTIITFSSRYLHGLG